MFNLVLFRFSAIVFRSGRGPPGTPPLTRALRCAPLRLAPLRRNLSRNLLALRVAQPVVVIDGVCCICSAVKTCTAPTATPCDGSRRRG